MGGEAECLNGSGGYTPSTRCQGNASNPQRRLVELSEVWKGLGGIVLREYM